MAARAGKAERARNMLDCYLKAFISRNGFHINGDNQQQGLSMFYYRPFTLEGNFAAGQAVHEMLLQSWGGVVRIFPAVSKRWEDVSFDRLRSEGAFRVSAKRRGGATRWVRIEAERDGVLRLRDPFSDATPTWRWRGVKRDGGDYVVAMRSGDVVEGAV
jgi:alpha-L-fucosidase 2